MHKNLSKYAEKGGSKTFESPFKLLDLLNLLNGNLEMCLIFGNKTNDLLNILLPPEHRKGVRWNLNFWDRTTTEGGYSGRCEKD
jgi:hypothetical protein